MICSDCALKRQVRNQYLSCRFQNLTFFDRSDRIQHPTGCRSKQNGASEAKYQVRPSTSPSLSFAKGGHLALSHRGHHPAPIRRNARRLQGTKRQPAPVEAGCPRGVVPSQPRVILGVDPSLRGTGYGVIRAAKPHFPGPHPRHYGLSGRLGALALPGSNCPDVRDVLDQFHPEICVVEGLFYAQNLQTALIMGEARARAWPPSPRRGWTSTKSLPAR